MERNMTKSEIAVNYTGGGYFKEDPEIGFVGERADNLSCRLTTRCDVFIKRLRKTT